MTREQKHGELRYFDWLLFVETIFNDHLHIETYLKIPIVFYLGNLFSKYG